MVFFNFDQRCAQPRGGFSTSSSNSNVMMPSDHFRFSAKTILPSGRVRNPLNAEVHTGRRSRDISAQSFQAISPLSADTHTGMESVSWLRCHRLMFFGFLETPPIWITLGDSGIVSQ